MSKYVDGTQMKALAKMIQRQIPCGFALLVFDFDTPGIAHYISNADRDCMIEALREKANTLEQKRDFPTPEHN